MIGNNAFKLSKWNCQLGLPELHEDKHFEHTVVFVGHAQDIYFLPDFQGRCGACAETPRFEWHGQGLFKVVVPAHGPLSLVIGIDDDLIDDAVLTVRLFLNGRKVLRFSCLWHLPSRAVVILTTEEKRFGDGLELVTLRGSVTRETCASGTGQGTQQQQGVDPMAAEYRIESSYPISSRLVLAPESTEYVFADVALAVAMAAKSVTVPAGKEIRVVHVPTGEVVFRKSAAAPMLIVEEAEASRTHVARARSPAGIGSA